MASIFSSNGTVVYQRDNIVRVQVSDGKPARVFVWRPDLRENGWFKVPNKNWKKIISDITSEVRTH